MTSLCGINLPWRSCRRGAPPTVPRRRVGWVVLLLIILCLEAFPTPLNFVVPLNGDYGNAWALWLSHCLSD